MSNCYAERLSTALRTSPYAYHLSLESNAPVPRRVEHPSEGKVIAIPQVGGLHHRYTRAA